MTLQRFMVLTLAAALAGPAWAAGGGGGGGSGSAPAGQKSSEVVKAEKLIKEKKWDEAVQVLTKAAERDGSNADIYNWLGYSERNRGNTDAAFAHYARALQLDPKHRGAHEYVGEAYLQVGNVEKAKEHLATLGKLCRSRCEEYKDLKEEIQEYEEKQASAGKGSD
jgi:tetratricopeptide (TPR) repeat protein